MDRIVTAYADDPRAAARAKAAERRRRDLEELERLKDRNLEGLMAAGPAAARRRADPTTWPVPLTKEQLGEMPEWTGRRDGIRKTEARQHIRPLRDSVRGKLSTPKRVHASPEDGMKPDKRWSYATAMPLRPSRSAAGKVDYF